MEFLRLNDVALSGDGEPTICKNFAAVCECVDRIRRETRLPSAGGSRRADMPDFKLVLITNATALNRPEVQHGLGFFSNKDEIWAKLDAGTNAYFQQIDRTGLKLEPILNNIAQEGRQRSMIIQSLFLEYQGAGPSDAEIEAYIGRLDWLQKQGCRIELVQVYSIARPPAESSAKPLSKERLEVIAAEVRKLGLKAETY